MQKLLRSHFDHVVLGCLIDSLDQEPAWRLHFDHGRSPIESELRIARRVIRGWRAAENSAAKLRGLCGSQHHLAGIARYLGSCDLASLHFALLGADRYDTAGNRLPDA